MSRDHFINPYTFVGLGPRNRKLRRAEPAGHHTLAPGNYLGEITATLTTRSPLLVRFPDRNRSQAADFPRRTEDGTPFLPGSSLHGALRSMHEILAGGCLRVFDRDFVPSYRTPVADEGEGRDWRLGLVTAARDGRAQGIRPLDLYWLRVVDGKGNLLDGWVPPTSGDRFVYVPSQTAKEKGRPVLTAVPQPMHGAGGQSQPRSPYLVVLISDASARRRDGSYWAAFGLVTPTRPSLPVTDDAWSTFVRLAEHTDDWRQARQDRRAAPTPEDEPTPATGEVRFPPGGHLVGRRYLARPWLRTGQVVWIRHSSSEVIGIALARFWRYPGSGTMNDRVPEALRPCDDPRKLCPSCRVFGSAEDREEDEKGLRRRADQLSYRGHVRVLDAVVTCGTEPYRILLAPMAQPRPGAGQFYLDQRQARAMRRSAEDEKRPIARWGEKPDRQSLRQMRGRKMYWRTDVENGRRRDRARQHSPAQFVTDVEVLPTGTRLAARLVFDNLSLAEIGGVLAALAPDRLFTVTGQAAGPGSPHLLSVGGGKPFGFGSVEVSDLTVRVETARSRYVENGAPDDCDVDAALAAFAAAVDDQTRALWPQAAAATQFGRVDDRLVWYPPGERWPAHFDPRNPHAGLTEDHDRGFAFWARSTGQVSVDGDRGDLVDLPDVLDDDQRLPIQRNSTGGTN